MNKLGIIAVFTLVIAGCGGGEGSPPPVESTAPQPPIVVKDPSGIWKGTIFYDGGGNATIKGLITTDGEGRLLTHTRYHAFAWDKSSQANWDSDGNWAFNLTVFTSGPGPVPEVTRGTFTGEVYERWSINGDFELDTKLPSFSDSGRISLSYQQYLYERPSSLSRLEGIWEDQWGGVVTINVDGSFFMQYENGCVFNGLIEVVDPQHNGYRLIMEGSFCGSAWNGTFQGLGFLDSGYTHITDGLFDVQMDNGKVTFYPLFERL